MIKTHTTLLSRFMPVHNLIKMTLVESQHFHHVDISSSSPDTAMDIWLFPICQSGCAINRFLQTGRVVQIWDKQRVKMILYKIFLEIQWFWWRNFNVYFNQKRKEKKESCHLQILNAWNSYRCIISILSVWNWLPIYGSLHDIWMGSLIMWIYVYNF